MARPLRIEYPGAWYHVMNRGRQRESIYKENKDYELFLQLLAKSFELFELEVHAYSLMPNHYHLLLHTPRGNLSRAMRHVNGVYTQKFNRRYRKDGVLFRGRYKAILVHDDSYIMELVRYIHRNPIATGLEKQVGQHRWTSHRMYLNKSKRPGWLQTEKVLGYFGKREKEAFQNMNAFVKKEVPAELAKRLNGKNWPAMLGPEGFKKWVKTKLLGKRLDEKGIPELRKVLREEKISRVKEMAKKLWGYEDAQLRVIRRGREDYRKRGMIYVSRRYLKASSREIGEEFGGISYAAVSMQYGKAEKEVEEKKGCYPAVKELLNEINLQLKS